MRVSLAFVALVCACARSEEPQATGADTYAVYAAAVDSFEQGAADPMRIASRTWPYSLARSLGDTSDLYVEVRADPGVGHALLEAYDAANEEAKALWDCFPERQSVELVEHDLQPNVAGPILLSGVGFNRGRTRAIVGVGQVCGPLCSSFVVYLLVRDGDRWHVARRVLSGAS